MSAVILHRMFLSSRLPLYQVSLRAFSKSTKLGAQKISNRLPSPSINRLLSNTKLLSNRGVTFCLSAVGNSNFNCFHSVLSRNLSTSATKCNQHQKFDSKTVLESWTYEVCRDGSMDLKLPFSTLIKPLPPQEYPDMNKVILQLHYQQTPESDFPSPSQLSEICDLYDLKVNFDSDKANMNISCDLTPGVSLPLVCYVQVPLQYNLSVNMLGDSNVSVERMESNSITVNTDRGDCNFRSIKSMSASVFCKAGSILCKSTFLGNIVFHCGKSGSIETDKIQGSTMNCETEMGNIRVKSLYTGKASFKSDSGNVHLGHCHGHISMQGQRSQFKVESLDGDLDVALQCGSVDVHFSHHNKANIEVDTGNVSLSFQEGVNTDLSLDCSELTVGDNVKVNLTDSSQPHHIEGYIGQKGRSQTNVKTVEGSVKLRQLDWIQTTKLASFMEKETQD